MTKVKLLFALLFVLLFFDYSHADIQKGEVINYDNKQWLVMQVNNDNKTVLLCPYYQYNKFFNSSEWGWFYNEKCIIKSLDAFQEKKQQPIVPQPQQKPKKLTDQEIIKLATNPHYLNSLSATEYKKMYEHVTNIAVMQPTKQNIAAYMYMTNFTRVKSLIFAHAVTDYTMNNPKYNMIKKLGETSWSYDAYHSQQNDKVKKMIESHRKNLGIIVFIKYGCPFCEKQLPVLNWLQSDYHIDVVAVSLNQCPANTSNIQCMVDPAAFKLYNIQYEPTMVLVIKQANGTPKFEPVGVGLTDEVTLANRIYYFVKGYYQPETEYTNSNLFKLLEEGQ